MEHVSGLGLSITDTYCEPRFVWGATCGPVVRVFLDGAYIHHLAKEAMLDVRLCSDACDVVLSYLLQRDSSMDIPVMILG